jgi:hypothetical protein
VLTAIRKFFGLVALIWLGWVALTLVAFGITLATGTRGSLHENPAASPTAQPGERRQHEPEKRSRGSPASSPATQDEAKLAAEMFLIAGFTAPPGILSCLIWFGLKWVQASGRRRGKRWVSRAGPAGTRSFLDFGRWFELRNGQAVFAQGKHRGRLLQEVAGKNPEYLRWMLGEELPQDTSRIVQQALEREPHHVERRPRVPPDDRTPSPGPAVEASLPLQSPKVFSYEAPGLHLCSLCALRPGLFYCRSHRLRLCMNCMGSHDSPAQCSYIPGWRTEVESSGLPQPAGAVYSYEAPGRPKCPQCQCRPALFYCRAHRVSLCLNCVGPHDVPSECSYVPGWRGEKPGAKSAPTGGSGTIRARRKTGDVFGIS